MTDLMDLAAQRWSRIEAALAGDEGRSAFVKQVVTAYHFASDAYNAAYNGGPGRRGTFLAGVFAVAYMANFDYIRIILMKGVAPVDAIARMGRAAEWLERMEWNGLPRFAFVGTQEIPISRTAQGVHDDMVRYRAGMQDIINAEAAKEAAK